MEENLAIIIFLSFKYFLYIIIFKKIFCVSIFVIHLNGYILDTFV